MKIHNPRERATLVTRALVLSIGLFMLLASHIAAQTVPPNPRPFEKGAHEWGLHSGGAFSVAGGRTDRSYWMLAGRWGRILTRDLGSGPLRGNLEYGIEAIPALVMFQSDTVYAAGLTPFQLRYNFTGGRRIVPFLEIGAGILGSTRQIPEGTSRFNFADQGGIGVQILTGGNHTFHLGARYMHISNAGLADRNPGINSVYFFAGISWWR